MSWRHYAGAQYAADALQSVKEEINKVCLLLERHKGSLGRHAYNLPTKNGNEGADEVDRKVTAAFRRLSTMVQIASDEFHIEIDSAFKKGQRNLTSHLTL